MLTSRQLDYHSRRARDDFRSRFLQYHRYTLTIDASFFKRNQTFHYISRKNLLNQLATTYHFQYESENRKSNTLSLITSNMSSQLHILRHNCKSFSMNCTQIGILKETYQVHLSSLLKCSNNTALEPQIY